MSSVRSSSSHTYYSNTKSHVSHVSQEQSFLTLQVILEEKNRVIDKLKKQLHNQRIQLEFYIKKEMNSPLMVEFAKTCLPELTDDNMTVALAMNKFYRELGMKSRIMDLYDRVCNIAGRTNCIIQTQEVILNEILTNMRQYMNPNEIKKFLGNFDINTNYIEVFNSLLDTTLSLKRSMHSFRNCCDRLINTEEKRNEIVEQVYSLPQEERTICNYLVNIQMEKFELENIVKQISKKRKSVEPIVDEIDIIENNLKLLYENFDGLHEVEETDYCVTKMLEKVYAQAMSLLTLSREQREKYNKEMEQLKEENEKLREIIQHIDHRNSTTKCVTADFSDIEKLHNVIRKTISEVRKFEKSKTEELKQKSEECEKLKKKLSEVVMQKRQLQNLLETDSSDVNENELFFSN
ncbi:leucine-rich repeat-containing protein [Asbolus verrucosus]|uniref:Leucine-rich repeat-containing protein n=1 Tax=Asbolus verrucosus TaxID=1661398 RepID=A0A482VUU3_ASBVE|nr:leucine-rich repeat-containing protein [Asbolus verrucosus]